MKGSITYAAEFEKVGSICEMWAGGIREVSEGYDGVLPGRPSRPSFGRYGW